MSNNPTHISDVALSVFSGFTFRTKVENNPNGDLAIIQLKDLQSGYSGFNNSLSRINGITVSSHYYLQRGDILFIAKGANNYAIEYDLPLPKAIAVSAFFIIRPDTKKVVPSYLAWYINQAPVQQYLKENMAGTYVPNVNKSTVEQITVTIPPISIQQKIAAIDKLRKRESFLLAKIDHKRDVMVQGILHEALKA